MGSTRSLALAALVCLAPLTAEAGASAAWTAAKNNLPKATTVVVGLDLAQLTKSSLFSLAFPLILAQQPDVKAGLELIKSTCQLDPLKVVNGLVVGTDDEQKHGAIYIAVEGVDQAKIVSCFEAVGKAKGKEGKVGVKTEGKITELSFGDKQIYLSWIGTNVIVLPLEFTNKADLAAWSGAKGLAKSKVAKASTKVNTGGAVWAVSAVAKELDDKTKMKLGYGSVTMAASNIAADLHVQLGTAADAKAAADKAQKELSTLASSPGLAPNLKSVLTSVTVTSAADELQVKGTMPESDVLSLVGALMK
ncbi:MAG: hypothetical protein IPQ07_08600 [Myxococcales bacterium]|nr:hypothetical protein [Myxococcales bacterium]